MSDLNLARRTSHERGSLDTRLEGLGAAVEAAKGRVDVATLGFATDILTRADDRLRLSPEHTVVALAGATGSGKSSLFNAICGLDLAATGARRPTTSWPLACSWGGGTEGVLGWLGIPSRDQVDRASTLDLSDPQPELEGLVLLDLPDHDSIQTAHHLEVERLVRLADVLVWVLDPQKYADAAVHEMFLRPLASHGNVMVVVFNRVDELAETTSARTVEDARRLLAEDGLADVPLIITSAMRGDGLAELRAEIAARVTEKRHSVDRISADIQAAALRISDATGLAAVGSVSADVRGNLLAVCADATCSRFEDLPQVSPGESISIAGAIALRRAQVLSAVLQTADAVSAGMGPGWATAVHEASVSQIADLYDALDALGSSEPAGSADRRSWRTPARWAGGATSRRRGARIDHDVRDAVARVVDDLVLGPVERELDAFRHCRDGAGAALEG